MITLYISLLHISEHFRFTIYMMPYVEGFTLVKYVEPAVQYVRTLFPVKRIICDGQFPSVDVILFSNKVHVPWDMRKSNNCRSEKAIRTHIDGIHINYSLHAIVELIIDLDHRYRFG